MYGGSARRQRARPAADAATANRLSRSRKQPAHSQCPAVAAGKMSGIEAPTNEDPDAAEGVGTMQLEAQRPPPPPFGLAAFGGWSADPSFAAAVAKAQGQAAAAPAAGAGGKKKTDAERGVQLTRLPTLLTLQLKRFAYDFRTHQRHKLNAPFAFDTTVAFNTESRRGAVIAKTSNASRNAQAAAAARHSHAEAEGGRLRVVERLVADAVLRTDILLRDPKWSGAPQQHRRAVPAAWLRRYRKYSAEQGSSTRSQ